MLRVHHSKRVDYPNTNRYPSSESYPASGIVEGANHSYVSTVLVEAPRREVELSFDLTPEFYQDNEMVIAMFEGGSSPKNMAALVFGKNGSLKLRTWQNIRYPSQSIYPSRLSYPLAAERKVYPNTDIYPTFRTIERDVTRAAYYPSPNIYPSKPNTDYPSLSKYPSEDYYPIAHHYPYWIHEGDYIEHTLYPGKIYPDDREVLETSKEKISINILIRNPNTEAGEVEVLAQRANGRIGQAFMTRLNWLGSYLKKVHLGVIYNYDTPYSLRFENILLKGDVPDEEWYYIADYQGFKVDPVDSLLLWQGANIPENESTHSEYTELSNLARYNYARSNNTVNGVPKGIKWTLIN